MNDVRLSRQLGFAWLWFASKRSDGAWQHWLSENGLECVEGTVRRKNRSLRVRYVGLAHLAAEVSRRLAHLARLDGDTRDDELMHRLGRALRDVEGFEVDGSVLHGFTLWRREGP